MDVANLNKQWNSLQYEHLPTVLQRYAKNATIFASCYNVSWDTQDLLIQVINRREYQQCCADGCIVDINL